MIDYICAILMIFCSAYFIFTDNVQMAIYILLLAVLVQGLKTK